MKRGMDGGRATRSPLAARGRVKFNGEEIGPADRAAPELVASTRAAPRRRLKLATAVSPRPTPAMHADRQEIPRPTALRPKLAASQRWRRRPPGPRATPRDCRGRPRAGAARSCSLLAADSAAPPA
jgi:hypothetical protein